MNYYDEKDGTWSLMGVAVNVNNVDNTIQCQSGTPSVFIRLQEPVVRGWIESICDTRTTTDSTTVSTTTAKTTASDSTVSQEQTTTSDLTSAQTIGSTRPATIPPSQFDCPPDNGGNGLYTNPDDCKTFYECSNGVAYLYVT